VTEAEAIVQIHRTASLLVPEIILLATVCFMFLVGPLLVSNAGETAPGLRHRWGFMSLLALVVAWALWYSSAPGPQQGALFQIDQLASFTRGLSLSVGVLLALVLWNQIDDAHAAEAHACLLAILAGTNLVAAASDLVSLFLALELVSIPTYLILYLARRDRIGRETTVKYFLLSVFSSALVLYGMSWLYGVAGTTNLEAIKNAMNEGTAPAGSSMLPIAFAMLVAGLSFRIAAVPFHFYAPDVFQGTTASNAALLSFVPKVVGFVALLRLLPLTGVSGNLADWLPDDSARRLLALLAVVTMFTGNLMALRQRQLFRLMAYSSIAHAGYMLVGLAVGDVGAIGGSDAILFYLAVYGLMTIGVFALLEQAATAKQSGGANIEKTSISTLDDLCGLSQSRPATALLLAVCLFSLTGLPPTAGFLGKLSLFLSAWSEGGRIGRGLAIIMGINAGIAAWYYLRLIALMFLDPTKQPDTQRQRLAWPAWLAGLACSVATIAIFFAPQWLWNSVP
jgi:NADH-quinone oxidoreductase subunit N